MKKHTEHELIEVIAQKIKPIIEQICSHPFIIELSNGSLEERIYNYYLLQDHFYLSIYSKVLNELANKANIKSEKNFLMQCAIEASQEIAAIKYKNNLISWRQSTKACFSYIQFLLQHIRNNYTMGLSSVFPCFFVYKEVAQKSYPMNNHNSYLDWFNTYNSEVFIAQTNRMVEIINREYDNSDKNKKELMLEIIEQGCLLEWQFWDDAYHQKQFCLI